MTLKSKEVLSVKGPERVGKQPSDIFTVNSGSPSYISQSYQRAI